MLRPACFSFLALVLSGCDAHSQDLPASRHLSPERIHGVAAKIEQRYPESSATEREAVLRTVLRAVDEMVFVEGGEFEMGDFGWPCDRPLGDACEWPCGVPREQLCRITVNAEDDGLHLVRLTSYYLSSHQTRLGDFDLFQQVNDRPIMDAADRDDEALADWYQPDKPAPTKDWQQAKDYCNWLGDLSGLPVDLPTEAQWEYAARNRGQHVVYPTDNGRLDLRRNYPPREDGWTDGTFPVGSFPPNPLGIYDMAGNATDWVDDYDPGYDDGVVRENPRGQVTGTYRVKRGKGMDEHPSILANTVVRWPEPAVQEDYSLYSSFRCSVQTDQPLK